MSIQSPNIRRRDGIVTASGIHVVPEPILSMLTPAGPIIMSSSGRGCTRFISVGAESFLIGGFLAGGGVHGMPGMFIGSVACALRTASGIAGESVSARKKTAVRCVGNESIFHPK